MRKSSGVASRCTGPQRNEQRSPRGASGSRAIDGARGGRRRWWPRCATRRIRADAVMPGTRTRGRRSPSLRPCRGHAGVRGTRAWAMRSRANVLQWLGRLPDGSTPGSKRWPGLASSGLRERARTPQRPRLCRGVLRPARWGRPPGDGPRHHPSGSGTPASGTERAFTTGSSRGRRRRTDALDSSAARRARRWPHHEAPALLKACPPATEDRMRTRKRSSDAADTADASVATCRGCTRLRFDRDAMRSACTETCGDTLAVAGTQGTRSEGARLVGSMWLARNRGRSLAARRRELTRQ